MADIDDFRSETRAWLEDNCPAGARGPGPISTGATSIAIDHEDTQLWLDRMIEKGWTAPVWPTEYGGGGLSTDEYMTLIQEMRRIDARAPLGGMGVSLIGPTLLEYGTDEQKERHIPRIVRGEVAWCQGYSEPGSGSDLASLRTRAEDKGDHFVVNGQKIWTSGAQYADWIFALVRTDPNVPKHEGISFVLMDMHQDGITVRPIRLISASRRSARLFFDNAIARKDDLVGELNKGWTVGKRLLQHERGSMASLVGGGAVKDTGPVLEDEAKAFSGDANGRIADAALRDRVLSHNMNSHVFHLTQRRTVEEASDGSTPGTCHIDLQNVWDRTTTGKVSLFVEIRGTQGLGWTGDPFTNRSLMDTRAWLPTGRLDLQRQQ
ncbi:MAG: acyl-CoA dehydrogenase [Gammaproteobacteria bacterium]|nr:MAG: acyl-CoA dehydrogenase [Gammaproteobacteria bacterium]